jgi:antitoxin component YwqK of YwqJK toxin-antitoxin module
MNPAFVMLLNFIGVALLYCITILSGAEVQLLSKQRKRIIFYPFLCFIIFSCKREDEKDAALINEIKIAKTVPAVYFNDTDKDFSKHQDTVYYKDQFFTGYRFSLYPNGDTAILQSYFNGVEEGTQIKWYPNHQLQEERFYINGKKEGIHKGWWPDGKKKFVFTACADKYEGESKEWYSSGLLEKHFHYKNGQEEGGERLWWDNGSVRANYVIRQGKKYGLIGLKTCINPYDSIIKK